jgi:hypothetical protein
MPYIRFPGYKIVNCVFGPNIHEILKKNIKMLYNSEKMKRIFDEP